MKDAESLRSSESGKREYEIVMDMITQLLEAGLEEYNEIYDRVRKCLEIDEPKLTQSQWAGRWSNAIEKLKEGNRISIIPKRIRLIEYPREEEIIKIIEDLKTIDNQYIVEIGLQRLSQLSGSVNVAFYSSLLDALDLIVERNYVYNNHNMFRYLLQSLNNILYFNYENEPEGCKEIITRVDDMIDYIYTRINSDRSYKIIYNSVQNFPKYSRSEEAVNAIFGLIRSLDDSKYENVEYKIGNILYSNEYKVSKIYSEYIEEQLKKIILEENDKIKERAKNIMSLKIQYMP